MDFSFRCFRCFFRCLVSVLTTTTTTATPRWVVEDRWKVEIHFLQKNYGIPFNVKSLQHYEKAHLKIVYWAVHKHTVHISNFRQSKHAGSMIENEWTIEQWVVKTDQRMSEWVDKNNNEWAKKTSGWVDKVWAMNGQWMGNEMNGQWMNEWAVLSSKPRRPSTN